MSSKEPVLLTVLIESAMRRWSVGGIDFRGSAQPLLRSNVGDFDGYLDLAFDEQVNYLRHRFASVLQQGCDKLWHHRKKPSCIVFVLDGPLDSAKPDLSQRVAEHFVSWMTSPPVAFLDGCVGFLSPTLETVAGDLTQQQQEALKAGLPRLVSQLAFDDLWETARTRRN